MENIVYLDDPINLSLIENPVTLDCGHLFDNQTIESWFTKNKTCPMCQKSISTKPRPSVSISYALHWVNFANQLIQIAKQKYSNPERTASYLGCNIFLAIVEPDMQPEETSEFLINKVTMHRFAICLWEFCKDCLQEPNFFQDRKSTNDILNFLEFSLHCPPLPHDTIVNRSLEVIDRLRDENSQLFFK